MVVTKDEEIVERVSGYDFTISYADETPELRRRWENLPDLLAKWLIREWKREHGEAMI